MVLSCIDTVEVILSDWRDAQTGTTGNLKKKVTAIDYRASDEAYKESYTWYDPAPSFTTHDKHVILCGQKPAGGKINVFQIATQALVMNIVLPHWNLLTAKW